MMDDLWLEKLENHLVKSLRSLGDRSNGISDIYQKAVFRLFKGYRLKTIDMRSYMRNFIDDESKKLDFSKTESSFDPDDYTNIATRYFRDCEAALASIKGHLRSN